MIKDFEQDLKEIIDDMTYTQMLSKIRFAPAGDFMFKGAIGKYFQKEFAAKAKALTPVERVRASKLVGWGKH